MHRRALLGKFRRLISKPVGDDDFRRCRLAFAGECMTPRSRLRRRLWRFSLDLASSLNRSHRLRAKRSCCECFCTRRGTSSSCCSPGTTRGDNQARAANRAKSSWLGDPAALAELEAFRAHFRLARQLSEERKKQRLTQQGLAKISGIRQSEISQIENGRGNPTVATLEALLRPLGKTLAVVNAPKVRSASRAARALAKSNPVLLSKPR
jgi:DNA-binding XRE family transcriptional regulator